MSIITRCPACSTTFRVTPQQLQAQHGMVRCGRCANVFDGFKTLATLGDGAPAEGPMSTPVPDDIPTAAATPLPVTEVHREPAPPPPLPVEKPVPPPPLPVENLVPPPPLAAETLTPPPPLAVETLAPPEPAVDVAELEAMIVVPVAAVAPARLPVTPLPMHSETETPRRRGGAAWALGALILLIGLGTQGAYFYRSDIAASVPEARPYLNRMCELLRCTVALPQRPRQISIEASDMQATDPANPGVIALTATLRNQATIELGYPALDVVLTNTKEHTVARRIFLPADYLAPGKDPRAGIAPNAEITVRLDLDTGDLAAAGFRLDVLAAPARS